MIKRLLLCFALFMSFIVYAQETETETEYKYQLSVCTLFQNETRFIEEWIDHHIQIGVEHFLLYNNNSTDDYKSVLNPYIERGIVELIEFPTVVFEDDWRHFAFTVQPDCYNDGIKRSKGVSKWLAIIDCDEFLFSPLSQNVLPVLDTFESYGGVVVNWICYGTSHVADLSGASVRENLVWRSPIDYSRNLFVKSIVQPDRVTRCHNPHFCLYKKSFYQVDTNLNRYKIGFTGNTVLVDKLRINHYWPRDEKFLHEEKLERYKRWNSKPPSVFLEEAEEMNQEYDPILAELLKKWSFNSCQK